jgi:hypothetical protein
METLAEQPLLNQQYNQLDHELRIRTDTETWLAETLNGNMRTSFEFSFDGDEFYGADSGAYTEVFDDAVQEAEIIAQQNPSLLFELRRRLIERGELEDMKDIGRGELRTDDGKAANTMVVVSDFPPELMDSKEDVGGYNTNRKQTMLRIITVEEDGTMRVTTQSLDQSNRQALEAVYAALGKQPEPGELLSQRINLDLPAEWQPNLVDNLTATYDKSMSEQHGGEWYGGRQPADDRNTYDFVRGQRDLVDWFTAEKLADTVGAEKLRYNLAATAKTRYERYIKVENRPEPELGTMTPESFVSVAAIISGQNLYMELEREGHRAANRGETFSGCGGTVKAETDSLSAEDQLSKSGYGNKTKASDEDCEFISKECPSCHTKNVKTKVTKHRISGSCGCSKAK